MIDEKFIEELEQKDTKSPDKGDLKRIEQAIKANKPEKVEEVSVKNFPEPQPIPEYPKEIKVTNFPEPPKPPKEIKVTNFPEQKEYPKEVSVKEGGLNKLAPLIVNPLLGALKGVTRVIDAVTNKTFVIRQDRDDPRNPLSVRLSNGKDFYNAIMTAVSQGMAKFPFINTSGNKQEALTDLQGRQHVLGYGYNDTNWHEIHIEEMTRSAVGIDYPHHEVHDGNSFKFDAVDLDMDADAIILIVFKTPDTTRWAHMVMEVNFRAAGKIELYEGPTWTQGTGTAFPIFNRNRNSATTSVLLEDTTGAFVATNNLIRKPAGFAGGTVIHDFYLFGDKKIGGEARDVQEIILKSNTTYAVLVTAIDGTNSAQVILNWYENTNKAV